METPLEFINITKINPLISKCQIKVCYVGEEPNRNKSIISKEAAYSLAQSLPGSPIVGYYNEDNKDFEGHNQILDIKNGKFELKDNTQPYGFVDLNAKVWFQKFLDDGINEHEYLMTEGYLWTSAYPECQRIIKAGNNQSMQLDEKTIDAKWTKDNNGKPQFFIINEALIEKLCILGEEYEPCFEGANITQPTIQFSLGDNFKNQLFSMISELKEVLDKGGTTMPTQMEQNVDPVVVEETIEEGQTNFAAKEEKEPKEDEKKVCPKCGKPLDECTCKKDDEEDQEKKKKYNLEEVEEYQELVDKYSKLENDYNELKTNFDALTADKDALNAQVNSLTEFKLGVEKKDKEALIASFYMLSDEDKSDVITNIDNYSLDDIEAKLSIICVRNKVSFNLDDDKTPSTANTTFNLNAEDDDSVPAWIKAVQTTAENKI